MNETEASLSYLGEAIIALNDEMADFYIFWKYNWLTNILRIEIYRNGACSNIRNFRTVTVPAYACDFCYNECISPVIFSQRIADYLKNIIEKLRKGEKHYEQYEL